MNFNTDHGSPFYPQYQQSDGQTFTQPPFDPQHHGDTSFSTPPYHHQPQQEQYQDEGSLPPSAFPNGPSNFEGANSPESTHTTGDYPQFDIFEWYPRYQSCQRYFLERAQHSGPTQAVAAFINIRLPFMCGVNVHPPSNSQPSHSNNAPSSSSANTDQYTQNNSAFSFQMPHNAALPQQQQQQPPQPQPHQQPPSATVSSSSPIQTVSLIPYLRRLVVTGLDFPGVLHGFFGDDWAAGIGPLHEQERRNYMFAAKSGGWASVKRDYDVGIGGGGSGGGSGGSGTAERSRSGTAHPATSGNAPMGPTSVSGGGTIINDETVPFMRPLQNPKEAELRAAEKAWSEWLLMEDWLIGPRAPVGMREGGHGAGTGPGAEGASGSGADQHGEGRGQRHGHLQEQAQGPSGERVSEMR